MSQYLCDACSHEITEKMFRNGRRHYDEALCFACQIVRNEKKNPAKLADMINGTIKTKFGVPEKAIEESRKLEYWNINS